MAKKNILVVDSDAKSQKVLEVSLKKAGFSVTNASDGDDALHKIHFSKPDLILSDIEMPNMNGFDFCKALKNDEPYSKIPFIFLTAQKSLEDKIQGLELGIEDYLTKPIFIKEIVARVNLSLQRYKKENLERRGSKTNFSGDLADMGMVDLIQTIDFSRKSGVLHISCDSDEGDIFFKDGKIIDAKTKSRFGADAVYRMLIWSTGTFEINFKQVNRPENIDTPTQGLLMEGMHRLDEWGRYQEKLPSLDSVFDVDEVLLFEKISDIPDKTNKILKLFDGHLTLMEIVDLFDGDDLDALSAISRLYFDGIIIDIAGKTGISFLDKDDNTAAGHKMSMTQKLTRIKPFENTPAQHSKKELSGFIRSLTTDSPSEFVSRNENGDNRTTINGFSSIPNHFPDFMDQYQKHAGRAGDDDWSELDNISDTDSIPTIIPDTPAAEPEDMTDNEYSENIRDDKYIKNGVIREGTNPGIPASFFNRDKNTNIKVKEDDTPVSGSIKIIENDKIVPESTANSALISETQKIAIEPRQEPKPAPVTEPAPDPIPEPIRTPEPERAPAPDPEHERMPIPKPRPKPEHIPIPEPKPEPIPEHIPIPEPKPEPEPEPDAAKIASALNEAAPPPANTEENDQTVKTHEYFEGRNYAQQFSGADEEEEWDYESHTTSPTKKIAITLIIAIIFSGIAGGAYFYLYKGKSVKDFDSAPLISKKPDSNKYISALGKARDNENKNQTQKTDAENIKVIKEPKPKLSKEAIEKEVIQKDEKIADEKAIQNALPEVAATDEEKISAATDNNIDTRLYEELMKKSKKGGPKKRVETLKKALEINPKSDEAMSTMASLIMEWAGTQEEAMKLSKEAVVLNSDNALAWLVIGYLNQKNGDTAASKDAYTRCISCSEPKSAVRDCKLLIK